MSTNKTSLRSTVLVGVKKPAPMTTRSASSSVKGSGSWKPMVMPCDASVGMSAPSSRRR
ncbi:MAG: hypothetical protein KC593_01830 [Myxococcales bacterium]|nr:hypothetical protein [Myxococcales bacterium]